MTSEREQALAPPPGFRKEIPVGVKFEAVIRQEAKCEACGKRLGLWKETQFDHVPAIQMRAWDPEERDVIPPSNDPDFIFAKHKDCHAQKTTGRKGESKLNAVHGDVAEIAKLKRLTKSEIEFRQRLLAKDEPEADPDEDRPKPRSRWPKRPFRSGKHGSSAERSTSDDAGAGRQRLN